MSNPAAIPLVVVSHSAQAVDVLRAVLRHGGLTSELTSVETLDQLPAALKRCQPELLLCIDTDVAHLTQIAALRNAHDPQLALLSIRHSLTEEQIGLDMAHGARDAMSLASPVRLQSVVARELRTWRLDQALKDTLTLANDTHQQTLHSTAGTERDALAVIQDGMLTSANQPWLTLLGIESPDSQIGLPVMDLFDESSHIDLKSALVACNKGSTGISVAVDALRGDGSTHTVTLWPRIALHAGAKCIELRVPLAASQEQTTVNVAAVPVTGLLSRQAWLEAVSGRLRSTLQGGSRYLLCLRIDDFAQIERKLGPGDSQQVLDRISALTESMLMTQDIFGRFSSTGWCALIERGTDRDARGWAQRLQARLALQDVPWSDASVKPTLSVGIVTAPTTSDDAGSLFFEALDALQAAREAGNTQVVMVESTQSNTRTVSHDEGWVTAIRAALQADRFRLVQMPVASLSVVDTGMYDILLRMLDESGRDISPAEFLPAAQRNGLMRHIDRWVLSAALKLAARRNPTCLFLRLSTQSALDPTLMTWLDAQLRVSHIPPQRLCIQVPEETAVAYPQEIAMLATALRARRMRFALEHFGIGPAPLALLDALPVDFIKIDGSLMQGLTDDAAQRERVRGIATAASGRGIAAIAERIEDANTMTALWDLGVDLLQGHLIQMHEEVVLASA